MFPSDQVLTYVVSHPKAENIKNVVLNSSNAEEAQIFGNLGAFSFCYIFNASGSQ
ncbi:hypothetical protein HP15_p187g169 (plasmid) [Marinobacter adhaerens HP15]|uniref:Uncharacterized protein n=1 Tax=Marinobacter adhaerens (strain DSM 23420 / HP15) TaxID=225937 RepID=E4PSD1_MARAH|nr:hypothetical protein HP15_p187g169 [Marinobacter adhaerens HP15]